MVNIVMTRIDSGLLHSRVTTQWFSCTGGNLIIVVNDRVAESKLLQGLMDMAAPSYVAIRYWTIRKTIDTIYKASATQKIFLVCETPADVLALVEGGVPIKMVSIGNLYTGDRKRQVTSFVSVDDQDVAAFSRLRDLGVELEMHRVPSEPAENIEKLFR